MDRENGLRHLMNIKPHKWSFMYILQNPINVMMMHTPLFIHVRYKTSSKDAVGDFVIEILYDNKIIFMKPSYKNFTWR
jgi:hypothetical protein